MKILRPDFLLFSTSCAALQHQTCRDASQERSLVHKHRRPLASGLFNSPFSHPQQLLIIFCLELDGGSAHETSPVLLSMHSDERSALPARRVSPLRVNNDPNGLEMWWFNTEAFQQLQTAVDFPILSTPTGHCTASRHVEACINVHWVASPASFRTKSTCTFFWQSQLLPRQPSRRVRCRQPRETLH